MFRTMFTKSKPLQVGYMFIRMLKEISTQKSVKDWDATLVLLLFLVIMRRRWKQKQSNGFHSFCKKSGDLRSSCE